MTTIEGPIVEEPVVVVVFMTTVNNARAGAMLTRVQVSTTLQESRKE